MTKVVEFPRPSSDSSITLNGQGVEKAGGGTSSTSGRLLGILIGLAVFAAIVGVSEIIGRVAEATAGHHD